MSYSNYLTRMLNNCSQYANVFLPTASFVQNFSYIPSKKKKILYIKVAKCSNSLILSYTRNGYN